MVYPSIEINEQQIITTQSSIRPSLYFWSVWTQHQTYLLQRCRYWMGGNQANAEDALSQAMLKAWERWPASQLRDPRAWLIRLTHNHCVDLHRKSGRQAISTDQIETATSAETKIHVPEETILQDELKQVLHKEIHNLPSKLQIAVSLYYLQERTTQEIAQQLSISENNVHKRLQKARARLRPRLDQYLYSSRRMRHTLIPMQYDSLPKGYRHLKSTLHSLD